MKNGKRDYKRENLLYNSKPEQKKNRAARNGARRQMAAKLGESAIKGKDIGHKQALSKGGSNKPSNWKVQSVKANRSYARKKDGSMRSGRAK